MHSSVACEPSVSHSLSLSVVKELASCSTSVALRLDGSALSYTLFSFGRLVFERFVKVVCFPDDFLVYFPVLTGK